MIFEHRNPTSPITLGVQISSSDVVAATEVCSAFARSMSDGIMCEGRLEGRIDFPKGPL